MISSKLIDAIGRLDLDLKGKTILTEAATGAYAVTSILAAMAGAEVYAYTRSTQYGSVEEVRNQVYSVLNELNRPELKIQIIEELNPEIISKADIITNSGHLRPLNEKFLKHCKNSVVIPLMYEAWEWRAGDLDLDYCKKKNISVGATNERHPDVDVFNFLGDMAIKMIFDAGLCLYKNKFILICNNDFGPFIAKSLSGVCEKLAVCDKAERKNLYQNFNVEWIGDFPSFDIPADFRNASAIIFTGYPFDQNWIGKNALIKTDQLKSQVANPFILRFAGDIHEQDCTNSGIVFYPAKVKSGHMGILPSEIGFDPIIRLQSGGLKVAELLLKGELNYRNEKLVDII